MKITNTILILSFAAFALQWTSCGAPEGNQPGYEYMPDMGHSIAQEANVVDDYYWNTWDEQSTIKLKDLARRMTPVSGTVPRGYAGVFFAQGAEEREAALAELGGASTANAIAVPLNGAVPYYYADTEEERTRAMQDITSNPFPITAEGLKRGENLYNIFCGICHGEKGDGAGYLVRDDGGKYPAQPTSFLSDELVNATEGRYYHAIYYGKNVMGAYKDKMSYEERWQVIHYIRSLQAKDRKLAYGEEENTLNAAGVPAAPEAPAAEQ